MQPRYSTRFAAMLRNKLQQVLFYIFWSTFLGKKESNNKNKRKEQKIKKDKKKKNINSFLVFCLGDA